MYEGKITIHDARGWTQANRRAATLALLELQREEWATQGQALTWTEEPDGLTYYVDGVWDGRITWAEIAAQETQVEGELWDGVD
jgi:hypothetical protein